MDHTMPSTVADVIPLANSHCGANAWGPVIETFPSGRLVQWRLWGLSQL
jgi:hypothetical protein